MAKDVIMVPVSLVDARAMAEKEMRRVRPKLEEAVRAEVEKFFSGDDYARMVKNRLAQLLATALNFAQGRLEIDICKRETDIGDEDTITRKILKRAYADAEKKIKKALGDSI